ncbi:MAG: BTAD domain-containing putative transcriptional regulator [Chloroflexota bacterium]
MSRWRLYLFGPPRLQYDDQAVDINLRKGMALIAYLAVTRQPHSRDTLATLLWSESDQSKARASLRRALHRINRLPHTEILITTSEIAAIRNIDDLWLDVAEFRLAAETCISNPSFSEDALAEQLDHLTHAAALYTDDFMAGFTLPDSPEFDDWQYFQRQELQQSLLQLIEQISLLNQRQGNSERAIHYARQRLSYDLLHEPAHRQLMRLYAQSGQQASALNQYQECRRILDQELGVQPDTITKALAEQIQSGVHNLIEHSHSEINLTSNQESSLSTDDLYGAPLIGPFLGRVEELSFLRQSAIYDKCCLVVVLGMGGIGKTSLVAQFANECATSIERPFDRVIWRSMLNAPTLIDLLADLIPVLSNQQYTNVAHSVDEQLRQLLTLFRQQRCLVVLDNAESIMQIEEDSGTYRRGYDTYRQLWEWVANSRHQSTLIVTSRENFREVQRLTHDNEYVRAIHLNGLPLDTGNELLSTRGLAGEVDATTALINRYSGNPLALKLVAETVQELYNGDLNAFLSQETVIFDDIRSVLSQQFTRLSSLEQEILLWLAIEREPVTVEMLLNNLVHPPTQRRLLEGLRSLRRCSLIETPTEIHDNRVTSALHENDRQVGFQLQNVVTEFLTDYIIEQVIEEFSRDELDILARYALIKTSNREYIRTTQTRLLLQPIVDQLISLWGNQDVLEKLRLWLRQLRHNGKHASGYSGGNILNLLLQLNADLDGFDFSHINVWQADLQGAVVRNVDFQNSDLKGSLFTDTFGGILEIAFSPDGMFMAAGTFNGQVRIWHTGNSHLLHVFPNHSGAVWSVCFSPDGQMLASADDKTVRFWKFGSQPTTNQPEMIQVLPNHFGCKSICFSPDGKRFASTDDEKVCLWDISELHSSCQVKATQTLHGHSGMIWAICFSPDGQMLASGGEDHTIHLWDVCGAEPFYNAQQLYIIGGHEAAVTSLSFRPKISLDSSEHPDSAISTSTIHHILVSGSVDQTVRLWSVPSKDSSEPIGEIQSLQRHTGQIWSTCFSPNGQMLATAGDDWSVRLWDMRRIETVGRAEVMQTLHGHTTPVLSTCFSPDGKHLVSGDDQTIRFWQLSVSSSLEPAQKVIVVPSTQSSEESSPQNFSDRYLVQFQAHQTLQGYTRAVWSLSFSPDGYTLASAGTDRIVRLWDVSDSIKSVHEECVLTGHASHIVDGSFSPDGQTFATASADQTVKLWDVSTLKSPRTGNLTHTLHGHTARAMSICFSPDGKYLASGGKDQTVQIWDIPSLRNSPKHAPDHQTEDKTIQVLKGHTSLVFSLCFSPDSRFLATAGGEKARLWDVSSFDSTEPLQPVQQLQGHIGAIVGICYSPDGKIIATGGEDQTIRLWDVSTLNLLDEIQSIVILRELTGTIVSVCFSPNGQLLASGGADQTIRLWDVSTLLTTGNPQPVLNLEGHNGWIRSAKFSPNGRLLASGSDDETIKLWDIQTGTCLQTICPDGPYAGMNISGVEGLAPAQISMLKDLGAVEY